MKKNTFVFFVIFGVLTGLFALWLTAPMTLTIKAMAVAMGVAFWLGLGKAYVESRKDAENWKAKVESGKFPNIGMLSHYDSRPRGAHVGLRRAS